MKPYKSVKDYFNNMFKHIQNVAEKYPSLVKTYMSNVEKPGTIEEFVEQCSDIRKNNYYTLRKDKEVAIKCGKEVEGLHKKLNEAD